MLNYWQSTQAGTQRAVKLPGTLSTALRVDFFRRDEHAGDQQWHVVRPALAHPRLYHALWKGEKDEVEGARPYITRFPRILDNEKLMFVDSDFQVSAGVCVCAFTV